MHERRFVVCEQRPRTRPGARFHLYPQPRVAKASIDRGRGVVDLTSNQKPASETWVRALNDTARLCAFVLLFCSGRDEAPDLGSHTPLLPDGTAHEHEREE